MLSRWYRILFFVLIAAIWFDGIGSFEHLEKQVLSYMLLGGLAPVMWFDTIIHFGLRPLRNVPMMGKIFLRSKRGGTLTGMMVLSLLFLFSPFGAEPHSYRLHLGAIIVLTILFLSLQPPCTLVLGTSNRETGRVLQSVSNTLFPFRVVALLDHRRTGYVVGTFSLLTDNLRTESDHHWRFTVDQLADSVPLIILDARTDSPIVVTEVAMILERPNRLKHSIFVIGTEGQAPALYANGVSVGATGIRAVKEEDIAVALKAWRGSF